MPPASVIKAMQCGAQRRSISSVSQPRGHQWSPPWEPLLFPRQGANLGWACLSQPLPRSSAKVCVARLFLKHTKMQSLRRWAFIAGFCAKSSVIFAFPFPAEFPACSQPVTQRPGDVLFWEVEETPRVSLRKHDGEENAHC